MAGISNEERERRKAAAAAAEENAETESDAKKDDGKGKEDAEDKNPSVKTKSGTVIVYCKLPNGLSFPLPGKQKMRLNGSNHIDGNKRSLAIAGYGRTEIDADDWKYVMKVYSGMKVFDRNNPIIFTADSEKTGDAAARMHGGSVKTGLEQRNPKEIIKRAEREAGNKED